MAECVALIYGGRGFEREVSRRGASFILPLISECGYECIPIFIAPDGRWLVFRRGDEFLRPDVEDDGELGKEKDRHLGACAEDYINPESELCGLISFGDGGGICLGGEIVPIRCAFPLLHGDFGEDGSVQGALKTFDIPFIGEDTFVSTLCLDKAALRAMADGVSVFGAEWFAPGEGMTPHDIKRVAEGAFGYPMFIKPRSLGSSVGAMRIGCEEEFLSALEYASAGGTRPVIIEECVDIASELEVGVIRQKGKHIFTKVGKITNDGGFYSFDEKYAADSSAKVESKPKIEKNIENSVLSIAKKLVEALNIRSLCRVDFFLDTRGRILFNEINTMPGFTESSLFAALFSEAGISPRQLVSCLIREVLL